MTKQLVFLRIPNEETAHHSRAGPDDPQKVAFPFSQARVFPTKPLLRNLGQALPENVRLALQGLGETTDFPQ
jgi:hypothetical protein